ncbi:hypothetical protein LEP1GSC052_1561 [Leptospira kmetyi serovar Malaysia str. Bejo-Iso9]|nr:hypothetical protein LEP1GSC052_1561 [Leptospira kmetyi serovar Malaysia str. Bejo-Iso9]
MTLENEDSNMEVGRKIPTAKTDGDFKKTITRRFFNTILNGNTV